MICLISQVRQGKANAFRTLLTNAIGTVIEKKHLYHRTSNDNVTEVLVHLKYPSGRVLQDWVHPTLVVELTDEKERF